MKKNNIFIFLLSMLPFAAMGQMAHEMKETKVAKAICVLTPTEGNQLKGTIAFAEVTDGVKVTVHIQGLVANTKHGFHIHEFGDCSAPDGTSAGGHFNPHGMSHGDQASKERHDGDMGNLTTDDKGNVDYEYVDKQMKLNGSTTIIGHSVILHKNEDDLKTQPTGNSGPRIACGVIGIAK